jgi:hypothetical protein
MLDSMDSARAIETMQSWQRLSQGSPPDQAAESHMWRSLVVLVPDDSVTAAVLVDEEPGVYSLSNQTLLVLRYTPEPPSVNARAHTIDPSRTTVALTETLEEFGNQVMGGFARRRKWSFGLEDGMTLRWETRQVLAGGFGEERTVGADERLARSMASAAGWMMPTRDADGPDWE